MVSPGLEEPTPLEADRQAKHNNANAFIGYGQFNDQMRDALIKGGLSGAHEKVG